MGLLDGLTLDTLVIGALVALFWTVTTTVIVWKWIVPRFFGRYVKKTITEMLTNPDRDTRLAVQGLVSMILSTEVKTGRKIKDDDGKEHDEMVLLTVGICREISNFMLMKLKAVRGGSVSAAGQAAADELGLLGSLGPRKGQTSMDWVIEQAIPRVMPMLEKKVAQMIEKGGQL